ncbi:MULTISPECIES: acyl carrier protein [Chryseobacterium]|jgi:acyl carrier protein|uniref:Acyl carrier protein n=6 Tax=Chryseobacterium TaxID=59732 RepID=A0A511Y7Z6_9FLAO|nr:MULTISPECIES: phosphopantetheine-binding protein [Chryseobacterium]KFF19239.1 acyl carrier protein [Chryseobacterium sp. JM1]KMQ62000.1 acyl carrier protein [Chryseobacterium sp. BLS98]MBL1220266.1 acyl carrier protein [Chryseobacterium endalhagicum]MCT2561914.1 phosphopantetheine-binding protein [Chryseobacterium sp. pc1-10]MDP9962117.1 acyl carrier protein [Chryseobacterium lathyri]
MDTINNTLKLNHEELFTLLKGFITEVIGAEFVEEMDITPDSSFTKDLEMDSIEIVSFSEKIKAHFGDQIDFTGWLSSMDLDELINLDLRMIINYIYECQ